jgi:hypothetical protein
MLSARILLIGLLLAGASTAAADDLRPSPGPDFESEQPPPPKPAPRPREPHLAQPDQTPPLSSPTPPTIVSLETVKQYAAARSIPLPPDLQIEPPAGVPQDLAQFIGAWGGDNRWNSAGRQMILVVTSIVASGQALLVIGSGPPNANTYDQKSASWWRALAQIQGRAIEWERGGFRYKFTLVGNHELFGEMSETVAHPKPFGRSTITISRIR